MRQTGNGGSRDLLMLWTVWSGQLQPLGQIEVRKEQGPNVLEATVGDRQGPQRARARRHTKTRGRLDRGLLE